MKKAAPNYHGRKRCRNTESNDTVRAPNDIGTRIVIARRARARAVIIVLVAHAPEQLGWHSELQLETTGLIPFASRKSDLLESNFGLFHIPRSATVSRMRLSRYVSFLLPALVLSGCATHSPLACPHAPATRAAHVFFATDRAQRAQASRQAASGSLEFGPERTQPPGLQMGWQQIGLGPRHRLGLLDKDVTLAPAQVHSDTRPPVSSAEQALYRSDAEITAYVQTTLRSAIRATVPPPGARRQVLLFVHGYNTTFNYSVRKTAQLAADFQMVTCEGQMRGVPVAYSWPSKGSLLAYLGDEESAEWTQQRLVPFLQALSRVAREEGADLQIIAHSMGCRALVRSLAQIALTHRGQGAGGTPLAGQVILLAPDISRALFDQYFERFVGVIGHLTIYVSSKDRALAISSILHGGHQRLGFLEATIKAALQLTGLGSDTHRELGYAAAQAAGTGKIDMVDVSSGLADVLGHSYEDPEFIHDVQELIYRHTPAGTLGRSNLKRREVRPDLFGLFGARLSYFQMKK